MELGFHGDITLDFNELLAFKEFVRVYAIPWLPYNLMNSSPDTRPLCYADLRRFLGLILLLGVSGLLVWKLSDVILLFTVIFLAAMVLNPLVVKLEKRGVPRGGAVIVIVLGLIGLLAMVLWLAVPLLLEQVDQLSKQAPQYRENILSHLKHLSERYPGLEQNLPDAHSIVESTRTQSLGAVQWVLKSTFGIIGGVFLGVVALLLLIFTLSNPQPLVAGFLAAVPERHRSSARRVLARLTEQMGVWIKATLINGSITGLTTGILLYFIGVQPAFVFGILAFFGEFVPNIGPIVAAAPALFVALGSGLEKAGLTLLAILFVQTVSGNVLVPFVMGRQMELHPVAIVFFALSMGALFGVTGAILAVPTVAFLKILIDEFYLRPQRLKGQLPEDNIEIEAAKVVES